MFANRYSELQTLKKSHKKTQKKSQFIVIYGRRRIGKTTLAKKFLEMVNGIYIFIEPKSEDLILRDCEEILGKKLDFTPKLNSWEDLFNIALQKKLTVVFDEFQNLGVINPYLFSRFQKIWDDIGTKPGLLFIAIGSYVGLIKKIFRDSKQPLFGRATGLLRLLPFDLFASVRFLADNNMSLESCLENYAIFGGVPRYLEELEPKADNIESLFFDPTSPFKEEGFNILILEFGSQHKGYFSVLESISKGYTTPKEIADFAGMNIATVSKYLGELLDEYELVYIERPVTVDKKRYIKYRINDNFYHFWFENIYSKASLLEIDPVGVLKEIKERLPIYLSFKMEGVVKEIIINKKSFFIPTEIGRWWNRQGEEIDIVAVNDRSSEILFCEVKWGKKPISCKIVEELKRKSGLVQWRQNSRREFFLVVSRSGFTKTCIEKMDQERVFYWDIEVLKKMILGNKS
jgi:AAA+ ATPase superfamily predicted ATPase